MPTLNENLTAIRLLLDKPDDQRPSMDLLFQLLGDQVQHHHNQLQNSSAQWSVANYTLTTSPGVEDYLVVAADFGKPFFVYAEDATNNAFVRREIPFVMLHNIDQFYMGVRAPQLTDQHAVQFISFYRSSGAWYARVTPIPASTKDYVVWYETAAVPTLALGSTEGLSPFNHLIRVQTALAALPHCGWGEFHPEALGEKGNVWERKIRTLAAARTAEEVKYQKEFSTYLGTIMQAGVAPRDGYGDGDDTWWINSVTF